MENQDILDFANMVFSMEYGSINFEELYPKAYSRECCHIPIHHTIIEEGRIKALLDIYPVTMKMRKSGMQIRAAYIGTVAVHPKSRKKGYMTELMRQAESDARKRGFDIMLVDGDRHRYGKYGFEKAGIKYNFNVRGKSCGSKYSFEEIDENSGYLPFMYGLYMKRNVTARTRENFLPCLRSNLAATYIVLEGGKPAGYINASNDGRNILEFEAEDGGSIPEMIYGFIEEMALDEIGIAIGADEVKKFYSLEPISDYCNMAMSHMMKILNPEDALSFFAAWKKLYSPNENISSANADDIIKLWRELDMDDKEKTGLFTTFRCFTESQKGKEGRLADVPPEWLPLPFFLPDADAF